MYITTIHQKTSTGTLSHYVIKRYTLNGIIPHLYLFLDNHKNNIYTSMTVELLEIYFLLITL